MPVDGGAPRRKPILIDGTRRAGLDDVLRNRTLIEGFGDSHQPLLGHLFPVC
jgi:hypothetical protein